MVNIDLIPAMCQVVATENKKGPFILFVKEVEKSIIGNFEYHAAFKAKLEKLEGGTVVIGSHTLSDNRKEKACSLLILPPCCSLWNLLCQT